MRNLIPTVLIAGTAMFWASGSTAQNPAAPPAPNAEVATDPATRAILAAVDAVVKVSVRAIADARSVRTLGREREGSGVVLAPSGMVLTIGYLILEAEAIELTDNAGRVVTGVVAAYDHATGFGLIRPAVPLKVEGAVLGDSATVAAEAHLVFAPWGGRGNASLAAVASKRRFAGYWEYLIDDAIFTYPPRGDHSGAALIDRNGRVVGIGSLLVADAALPNRRFPGNMFVPVDLVKPILADLERAGRARETVRPWIGLSTQEVEGRLLVIRVQEEGPAALAGLAAGDVVVSIGGAKISTLEEFYRRLWSAGAPGTRIRLGVQKGAEVRDVEVRSIDRLEYMRARPAL
ncbi:MAG: serine protease [Burkholderiales bacterium]|nr:serine protease [Burkholderiales bacterium]